MSEYRAPVREMLFVMRELAGLDQLATLPGHGDATAETVEAVLTEAARLSAECIAPLNRPGDVAPSVWDNGEVRAAPGFRDAFRQYAQGGWQGLAHPAEYGGQQLPKLIATACTEMLNAANLSFALCPLLTDGAVEALLTAGSDALRQRYVPKLIDGTWTGTMNLTEPQAGSDLALVRTRATRYGDGTYRIAGTKIFITWGEHDMAENIVHLVLARTPDAPEGIKGISLFVVPKFLPDDAGRLATRNDVQCLSLEHKLGINASPTAVLQFGERGGATGFLVGEENRGLEYMFVMMNAARFAVGMQGIGIADRAYQHALAYARERVQSRPVDGSARQAVPIVRHPDVRRMLATMRAMTEGARALAYVAASHHDMAHGLAERDPAEAGRHRAIYEYLVPVVKGWSTEMAVEVASLGVQVHGGMGFIEETGAAQYYRDARILPIYEGTTAIQANDLVGRKTARDGGRVANGLVAEIRRTVDALRAADRDALSAIARRLTAGADALEAVVRFVIDDLKATPNAVYFGSVPYLKLVGVVLSGWQLARAALIAVREHDNDPVFYEQKIGTAQFFAEHVLPLSGALQAAATAGDLAVGMFETDAVTYA
jgi:alkylation response protein AidB-like acyl-CoA dehydrogenase